MYSSQPIFAAALLALGLIGSLGITWLFPLLAIVAGKRAGAEEAAAATPLGQQLSSLEILVPAHDEEDAISGTIKAISESAGLAKKTWGALQVNIRVGADACADRTAAVARGLGAHVEEFSFREKWKTLEALVLGAKSDWVALVDADVEWEPGLLPGLLALPLRRETLLGIAPAFGTSGHWKLEAHLKSLENGAGGPLSVHGATVFYDRLALQAAFAALRGSSWLNDDVSIPLCLRSRYPDRKLFYWVPERVLLSEKSRKHELGFTWRTEWLRRTRMLKGNLQVIARLLPETARRNPAVALLFLRRVFRVLWAYWLLAFGVSLLLFAALALHYPAAFLALVAGGGLLLPASLVACAVRPRACGMLLCSLGASLLAPISLLRILLGHGDTKWR